MISLAAVPLVIWVAVFTYLVRVDLKLARIEATNREDRR